MAINIKSGKTKMPLPAQEAEEIKPPEEIPPPKPQASTQDTKKPEVSAGIAKEEQKTPKPGTEDLSSNAEAENNHANPHLKLQVKHCPNCGEIIKNDATRCKYCDGKS